MSNPRQLPAGIRRLPVALVVAVACIAITAGVVACGNDDPPSPSGAAVGATSRDTASLPAIITQDDLDAVSEDSPQRAVLSWFQAIQFKDVSGAAQLVDPPVLQRVGRDVFSAAVNTVGSALGKPTFVMSRRRGDQVAVRTIITGYDAARKPAGSETVTFYLRKRAGKWRVTNLAYLTRSSDAMAAASRRGAP